VAHALRTYVQERTQGGVDVATSVSLLGRYAYIERSAIRALAGWFLRMPEYEHKIAMAYQLWGHAERVDVFRRRLNEMRGGHREANIEPQLHAVGEALLHAPNEPSFLAGLRLVMRHLIDTYREHIDVADSSANAMEQRILRRHLGDLQRDCAWLFELGDLKSAAALAWAADVEMLLAQAGGVSGMDSRGEDSGGIKLHHFQRPATLHFDNRIKRAQLDSYTARMDLGFEEKRIAEFKIFFNEFYAAALLATILFDAWNLEAPWEFTFDMSHHFWDEVRHAEFGLKRLTELGAKPEAVNLTLFERAQGLPVLHKLCYLTLELEVYFMPRKQPRVKRYQEAGDHRTQLFADVDWSDEGNHVQYGRKWVDHFLKSDSRSVEELKAEIAAHMERLNAGAPEKVPF
jgi:hypothetical protein